MRAVIQDISEIEAGKTISVMRFWRSEQILDLPLESAG